MGPLQPGHNPSSSSRSGGVLDWSWRWGVGVTLVWSLESCVVGVADLLPLLSPPYFLPRILPPTALPAAQVLGLPGDPQEVTPAWAHNGAEGLGLHLCSYKIYLFIFTFGCAGSLVVMRGLSLVAGSRRCSDCGVQALAAAASLMWSAGSGVSSAGAACGL